MILYSFSFRLGFILLGFTDKAFNEAVLIIIKAMVIQGRVL